MGLRNHKLHRAKPIHVHGGDVRMPGPVIASAALVSASTVSATSRVARWQEQAWDLYDKVSELRFGVSWIANALSRARLYVGRVDPEGVADPEPVTDASLADTVTGPLEELAGLMRGHGDILHRMAIHLSVPGETFLVGFDDPASKKRRWLACSGDEITTNRGGLVKIRLPETDQQIQLPLAEVVIIRLWRPHPRRAFWADSPMRALAEPLKELLGLSSHIAASVDSRLAGAGVLVLPDSATLPKPKESDGTPNPLHEDPFVAALIEAMVTPLQDRDSAAAVVPIVVRVPESAVGAVKHLSFATPLDGKAQEMRQAAIRRVATGLDLPAEILEGLGDVNHWGQWAIDESAIKLHIAPLLGLICEALTDQFLRPALVAKGVASPEDYALWYDIHSLTLRPNKASEAVTLYEQGLLSEEAVRRENGFTDDDAPDDKERERHTALQLALANGQLAPYLLPKIGLEDVDVPPPAPAVTAGPPQQEDGGPGEQDQGDGQQGELPGAQRNRRELPGTKPGNQTPRPGQPGQSGGRGGRAPVAASLGASLGAASDGERWRVYAMEIAALRALERAGNWLLNRQGRAFRAKVGDVPTYELHTKIPAQVDDLDAMLRGAFRELETALPDHPCLHGAVDYYVRSLITAGEPHQRRHLVAALKQYDCPAA
ncbi:MAG: hypothetical protein J2P26_07020 [Nocardiopsaceae bacterium]|nr:hypothetical protein [Nocardiopsaceae bacterium]